MFVVDALVGWLIGRLADAGYQELNTLVLGSDQERALKAAVTAAVKATAEGDRPVRRGGGGAGRRADQQGVPSPGAGPAAAGTAHAAGSVAGGDRRAAVGSG